MHQCGGIRGVILGAVATSVMNTAASTSVPVIEIPSAVDIHEEYSTSVA